MLILYGNIFKVTRNRLPADVRLRGDANLHRGSRRLEGVQVTTGTPLMNSVRRQSIATSMASTIGRVQHQTINSENSSASSDDRESEVLSRQASEHNSECFEMIHVHEECQTTNRPDVRCPHTAGENTTVALKSSRFRRFNSSPKTQTTSGARVSLCNFRHWSTTDKWRHRAIASASLSAGERTARRENKAAKTLAIVVGGFVVCWLPFFVLYVVEPFCASCRVSDAVRSALTWLGYANSLVNPFIYATYNRHFRHSFWLLTLGRFHACLPITIRLNDVAETRFTL